MDSSHQEDKATNHSARIATILAILSMCQARQKGNAFQRRFGLYLHSQGTRRDAISVLHALGYASRTKNQLTVADGHWDVWKEV